MLAVCNKAICTQIWCFFLLKVYLGPCKIQNHIKMPHFYSYRKLRLNFNGVSKDNSKSFYWQFILFQRTYNLWGDRSNYYNQNKHLGLAQLESLKIHISDLQVRK